MINQKKIDKFLAIDNEEMKSHEFIFEIQYDVGERIHREDMTYDEMKEKLVMLAKLAKPPRVRVFDKTAGVTI